GPGRGTGAGRDLALPQPCPPLGLDAAPDAYDHFDRRDDGWTQILLKPGQNGGRAGA
ncbi:MAG: hypothetical protein QOF29_2698, partial [bacterium]